MPRAADTPRQSVLPIADPHNLNMITNLDGVGEFVVGRKGWEPIRQFHRKEKKRKRTIN
jgi:hypothetical protein